MDTPEALELVIDKVTDLTKSLDRMTKVTASQGEQITALIIKTQGMDKRLTQLDKEFHKHPDDW